MSQQTPYIGCKISLISMLDIRYEGILHSVNSEKSTIALSKVRSFGTEERSTVHAVPARDEVYEYIIFKATDIKDLVVCSSAGPDYDPAIISVSSVPDPPQQEQKQNEKKDNIGAVPSPQQWNAVGGSGGPAPIAQPPQQPLASRPSGGFGQGRRGAPPSAAAAAGGAPSAPVDTTNDNVGTGDARNVPARQPPSSNYHGNNHYGGGGQLAQQQQQQRGPRGPPRTYQQQFPPSNGHPQQPSHHHHYHHQPAQRHSGGVGMNQPAESGHRLKFDSDFDFEEANEKFKEQLSAVVDGMANANIDDHAVSLEEIERSAIPSPAPENAGGETFYDKKTSFFDNISCESLEKTEGKNNRPDWKKERLTNTETFGHSAVRSLTYRRGPRGFVGGGAHGYHRYQNQNHFNHYNNGGGGRNNFRNYHQQQPPRHHQGHYGGGGQQQQYGGPSGGGGYQQHNNNQNRGNGGGGRAGPNGNNRTSGW